MWTIKCRTTKKKKVTTSKPPPTLTTPDIPHRAENTSKVYCVISTTKRQSKDKPVFRLRLTPWLFLGELICKCKHNQG